ncbi:unnamed protein product [Sphagnum balticum]
MDSLCANYASDDEDDEDQQPETPQSSLTSSNFLESSGKPSISGLVPHSKNSQQSDSRELYPSRDKIEQHRRAAIFQDFRDVKPLSEDLEGASKLARPSLFAQLPAPKSQPVIESQPIRKQTVTFKPPVNLYVLESKEEEEEEPLKKKTKPELSRSDEKTGAGLTALLPAPENSLGLRNALGSGSGPGGRCTAMEVVSTGGEIQVPKPVTESGFSGTRTPTMIGVPAKRERLTSFYNAGAQHQNLHSIEQSLLSAPQVEPKFRGFYGALILFCPSQAIPNIVKGSRAIEEFEDPVAQVLRAERRRGKEDKRPPPSVIEVRQADLTGGPKLCEDRLRTTGIAFGPSYQPAATNKDKPSKLHRRKHQIGSLFYEMKQKEMELVDRRAKGHLSKAETQAKYGWIYKVFDLKNYIMLYSISDENVQEIKISPGIMLLIFDRAQSHVPLKILSIEDGSMLKAFNHLLHRNKKVDFIEQFNEKLLVKQENENMQILDVRVSHNL